jgi:uncharacterized protein YsxB (DUF464 family)
MTTEKITINFGGFYESIHDSRIDNMIEAYGGDEYPEYNDWENIDFKKTFKSYIEAYCNSLSGFIKSEYNVDINFNDIELDSPKYYNYSTDTILAQIPEKQIATLNKVMSKNIDFLEFLKEHVKSGSGYISFYTYETALANKNNILIVYILEFICDKFNEVMDFYNFEIHLKEKAVA